MEKTVIEQCVRDKRPIPAHIVNAPELHPGLDLYFLAFLELTTCRTQGYAEGPISWLSIKEYAVWEQFDRDQIEDLFYHIRKMDDAYLNYRAEKITAQSKTKT